MSSNDKMIASHEIIEPSAPLAHQQQQINEQYQREEQPPRYEPPQYFKPLPQPQVVVNTQQPQVQQVMFIPMATNYNLNTTTNGILTSQPTRIQCPNCRADVLTNIDYKPGCLTWIITGSLCATGLFVPLVWCGFCLIPFCVDSCKDVVHSCPNCKAQIGVYERFK